MSLINQMLRDLEQRRVKSGHQLLVETDAKVVRTAPESRRLVIFSGIGVLLAGMIWVCLALFPAAGPLPVPARNFSATPDSTTTQNGGQALTTQVVPAPQEEGRGPQSLGSSAEETSLPRVEAASESPAVATLPVAATPPESRPSSPLGFVPVTTLLDLGLLEIPGSVRMVLEFGQLPDYRVERDGQAGDQIRVIFSGAGLRNDLPLPATQGGVVKSVQLVSEPPNLLLILALQEPVQLHQLQLAGDAFHGQRLVFELRPLTPNPLVQPAAPKVILSQPALPEPEAARSIINKTTSTLSAEEQAQRAYLSGLEKLARHDANAAELNFAEALRQYPPLLDARLQQVALLARSQRQPEAESLLQIGLELHPNHPELRKAYARLLLAGGELSRAIGILAADQLPDPAEDLEYHALLAALWQEGGQYAEAAARYQLLLQVRPQEGLWWLGLAVSQEQTGQLEAARKAYRQVLASPELRPDLAEFVRSRLKAL